MRITSPVFNHEGAIPAAYSCDGKDTSPRLDFHEIPEHTKSLALIMDDPDAPGGTFVHWVVYNIPPGANGLPEATPANPELPDGSLQGVNSFGKVGYGGPCPPDGEHRYFFKLYALSAELPVSEQMTKADLESAMEVNIIAQAELMGTYDRS